MQMIGRARQSCAECRAGARGCEREGGEGVSVKCFSGWKSDFDAAEQMREMKKHNITA